uniref:Zinc finger protein n=1 Tax=Rhabditophanes sp. KR3021 TaxID=114890 RepID=A0AC35UED2_9BILA
MSLPFKDDLSDDEDPMVMKMKYSRRHVANMKKEALSTNTDSFGKKLNTWENEGGHPAPEQEDSPDNSAIQETETRKSPVGFDGQKLNFGTHVKDCGVHEHGGDEPHKCAICDCFGGNHLKHSN